MITTKTTLREYIAFLEENILVALDGLEEEVAAEMRADLETAKNLPDYMLDQHIVDGWFCDIEI